MKNYMVAQLDEVPGVPCPCGTARRAFAIDDNKLATVHLTEISVDSGALPQEMTEIYVILEGEGIWSSTASASGQPRSSVFIKPGCRHRAVGKMKCLIVPIPLSTNRRMVRLISL